MDYLNRKLFLYMFLLFKFNNIKYSNIGKKIKIFIQEFGDWGLGFEEWGW